MPASFTAPLRDVLLQLATGTASKRSIPDNFVTHLIDLDQRQSVLRSPQPAARLRNPPKAAAEYLDTPEQQMPETVSALRDFEDRL